MYEWYLTSKYCVFLIISNGAPMWKAQEAPALQNAWKFKGMKAEGQRKCFSKVFWPQCLLGEPDQFYAGGGTVDHLVELGKP